MRQPPEKSVHGRCCAASSKPRPARIAAARAGAACAPMSASRVWISAMRCGSCAVSASASSAVRSVSAASTTSIRLSGPPGASCASRPMRARAGMSIAPCSSADLARDRAEQRGLADAVAADQPDPRAVRECAPTRRPAAGGRRRGSRCRRARACGVLKRPRRGMASATAHAIARVRRCWRSCARLNAGGRSCAFPDAGRRSAARCRGADFSAAPRPQRGRLPRPRHAALRAAQLHSRSIDLTHTLSPAFPTFFGVPGIEIEKRYDAQEGRRES